MFWKGIINNTQAYQTVLKIPGGGPRILDGSTDVETDQN